ncbi:hypothetical protein PR202_gb21104 [Eleusine coracana subsp. coracana]|uniref:Uncharacterized protein n=1 Tax=Eleusine coracana subsp. coracana TaxID=191504 RepID=A0AAV5FDX2_ELECO|nr:hypothetical protein PR202_gb21104 [Eleusine coracana subsp. coracana]
MNIYPFFAFNDPANQINHDFTVGNPNNPNMRDFVTGLMYHSLLGAQLDATYYAMEKLGFSGSLENNKVPVRQSVMEIGRGGHLAVR